ncbi:hypothetical protein [Methanobacterium sp. MBAC-LM]|uniref:hypothetical protein n=1 Tax=Methanobacterium sp. MBAC-LM TaxID=3412034 RepID=UPI003C75957E
MVWATKLKVSILENEKVFEKGKNNVKSINIIEDMGIIKIEYEKDSEWDIELIPIQNAQITYKKEVSKRGALNFDPHIRARTD